MRGLLPGDPEAALDAMQEALCDAAIGLKAFRGEAGLRTLLFSYARNKAADAIRTSASERRKAAMAGRASQGLSEPSAEDAAVHSDEALRVRRALLALGPEDRAVLRLREFEGASMREIAAVLGVSEGAAKLKLHRARKRFGRLWLREGN
jgi:RNA polymerase sigma-70 factor (ECF subfamily)